MTPNARSPSDAAREGEAGVAGSGRPRPSDAPASLAGLRVLVADDNVFNQELFEALMAGRGLEITCAADGRQAVELARATSFDLVLMDVQMPVMDGLEATRALRDLGLARLPIVALTANVVRPQIALCLAAGMNDHLSKPYTAEVALAMIAKWTVERDRQAAPVAARAGPGAA